MIHYFQTPITAISLPDKFTYPFHYTPHPLCITAAEEVKTYLSTQQDWQEEIAKGKMFGVLIVQTANQEIGYLAAFSGQLAGNNVHPFFVPPVYDLLQPDGFFKKEEQQISALNKKIEVLIANERIQQLKQDFRTMSLEAEKEIEQAKKEIKQAKLLREERRQRCTNSETLEQMIRESQFMKAELKRLEKRWKEALKPLEEELRSHDADLETLKAERKQRSADLQQRLFSAFKLWNARGEEKDLWAIFATTKVQTPPAGSGECAAPKLLQYAYLHHLKPIAMAEFWWGESPKGEVRKQGLFYPSCQGKCGPILGHMLQGLRVEENPLHQVIKGLPEPEIVYEDEWLLVVNKPAGLLSVPGKAETISSVLDFIRTHCCTATGPLVVHRLDMATSGLLVVAKTKAVHQNLQAQFKNRTIKKSYIALLEREISTTEGYIELPLAPDFLNRPRQIIDHLNGKPAVTHYRVLKTTEKGTRILFEPLTGRTHQLRVHAAHAEGLNAPIIGDELYGQRSDRLYLHAESLTFQHPITGESMTLTRKADF